jgi:hypothetical protein
MENKTIIKKVTVIQLSKAELERLKIENDFNVIHNIKKRKTKRELEYDNDMFELMNSIY